MDADEYHAKWQKAAEAAGHELEMDEDVNEVDWFADAADFHNGPRCTKCNMTWCIHCTPPSKIGPCEP